MVVFLEAGKNDDGNDEVSKNDDGNDAADENENERRILQLRSHNYVVKHLKIIGLMWKKYYNTFWLLSITTLTSILTTADTITTTSNTTNNNNSTNNNNNSSTTTSSDGGFAASGSATGINLLPRGHRHPLYTAIRRNHPFRPIVQDILNLDTSILLHHDQDDDLSSSSSSSSSLLPPFAFAATEYCSQSLVEPHNIHNHNKDYNINNNDVNVIERIYELLRANPAAILLATTTITTSRTVLLERRRRQKRTALAMATAAATSATSIIAPTVTPSKPALTFGQVSEVEGVGVGKQQLTSNIITTTTTTTTRNDGDGDGINPHGITNGDDNNDNNTKAADGDDDDDDAATIITITPNSKRMRLK